MRQGTGPAGPGNHRSRPRRRGAALKQAIFAATLAELADVGYAGLTMERVAERAGTGKAALYRRWPGRSELVMDAVHDTLPDPAAAAGDTGSLRGDLLAMLRGVAAHLAGPAGEAVRGLLGEALSDPQQAARVRAYARGRSGDSMRLILDRAARRGETDAAAVTDRQLEAGPAMIRSRFLMTGTVPDAIIVEIVDDVVLPLLRSPAPAPGGV